jgi:uncharacterized membrane protein
MNETILLTIIFGGVGVVFIALGIPLFQGRVRPNPWYGFRTDKTLSDEKVWYAVNRASGKDLVIAGTLIVVGSLVLLLMRGRVSLEQIVFTMTSVVLLGVLGMVVHGYKVMQRM